MLGPVYRKVPEWRTLIANEYFDGPTLKTVDRKTFLIFLHRIGIRATIYRWTAKVIISVVMH